MAAVSGVGGGTFNLGQASVDRRTGEMLSDDMVTVGGVYGDLFDVGELIASAVSVCEMFLVDIAAGRRDPVSAMLSLYLQASGTGVLMERKRWER